MCSSTVTHVCKFTSGWWRRRRRIYRDVTSCYCEEKVGCGKMDGKVASSTVREETFFPCPQKFPSIPLSVVGVWLRWGRKVGEDIGGGNADSISKGEGRPPIYFGLLYCEQSMLGWRLYCTVVLRMFMQCQKKL